MVDPIFNSMKKGSDPALATLLLRLDMALAEVLAVRDELAARLPAADVRNSTVSNIAAEGEWPSAPSTADDLIDTHAASARFGLPRDSISRMCRLEYVPAGGFFSYKKGRLTMP